MDIKSRLCQHFRSIGISSKESARFSNLASKWVNHSGPEWSVSRLKSLAAMHKTYISTGVYVVPEGWKTRTNRKGKTIISDGLVHRMIMSKGESNLLCAASFFRAYQVIMLDTFSARQVEKFEGNLITPQTDNQVLSTIMLSHKMDAIDIPNPGPVPFTPMVQWNPSGKKSPVPDGDGGLISVPRWDDRVWDIALQINSEPAISGIVTNHVRNAIDAFTGTGLLTKFKVRVRGDIPVPVVGMVSFIQEPGCKLRSVANPMLALQALGEPLKQKLQGINKLIPEILVHDQDLGRDKVSNFLKEGRTVWSFDSSAFTDRLPLSLQSSILRRLLKDDVITQMDYDVLHLVSQGKWITPKGSIVEWKVGQPLGFGPSFALATLAHWNIVASICDRCSVERDCFVIVGDDIAIANKEVAELYHGTMTAIGVSINMDKSMISSLCAEFCGKIITENGPVESVKVKHVTNRDQLIGLLGFYGKRGLKHLSYQERRWAVHVVLPLQMGGLSWSPSGMKYGEYLERILDVDHIQKATLTSVVEEFYSIVPKQHVEWKIRHISRFWEINTSEELMCDENLSALTFRHTSPWTGLPVSSGDQLNDRCASSPAVRANTLTSISDTIVRQNLTEGKLPVTYPALGRQGFINEGEVRPNSPFPSSKEPPDDQSSESRYKNTGENLRSRGIAKSFKIDVGDFLARKENQTCKEEERGEQPDPEHDSGFEL